MAQAVPQPLSAALLAVFPASRRPALLKRDLEPRLRRVVEAAQLEWPGVALEAADFMAYLGERVKAAADVPAALAELHTSDLYLACACAAGDAAALREFDRRLLARLPAKVFRMDPSPEFADEVKQLLRQRLFVSESGKILEYGGKGSLASWLQVAALRTAQNLRRTLKPKATLDGASDTTGAHRRLQLVAGGPDPELRELKRQYSEEFRTALETVMTSLSSRERNVLRLHFLENMSSGAIATSYGVTGAAVRVWIKNAREAILNETRRLLMARLKVDGAELDSLMGLVHSQLDLSISRMLARSRT